MRRLTGDEHLSSEFATNWPQYELDEKTRTLLSYARKLSEAPAMVEESDIDRLRSAGWDEQAIYEATALIGLFNFTGRIEAASGLPMDRIPDSAPMAESVPDAARLAPGD